MSKILVTGAAGFIGSHVCEGLRARGFEVVGIDCLTDYYSKKLKQMNAKEVEKKGVRIEKIDLAAKGWVKRLEKDFEYIYHLAAQPGISDKVALETYVRNNIIATENLVQFGLKNKGLKCMVNVGTSSIYGYYATSTEDEPPRPASYYGITKLAAEQLVLSQCRQGRLPACSLRLYSVYGPRERPEKLYPKLIQGILENKKIPLYSGAEKHSRSFTFVDDAVKGLLGVIDNYQKCVGEIINIGSDKEVKTMDGIKIIEKILGKKANFEKRPARTGDQIQTKAVIKKARKLLGYNPSTGLEQGLAKQVEWYRGRVRK